MVVDAGDDVPGPRESASNEGRSPSDATVLRSVLVRYESDSDRRTLYPADADEYERLTRWISADDGAFVALDASR